MVDPEGSGPRLFFQRVPEGKRAKNRVHLDVRAAPGLEGDARMAALEAGPRGSSPSAPPASTATSPRRRSASATS